MLRIELPLFLIYFTFMLSDPILTNLLVYRSCYVTLGYNKSDCALLGTQNATEETAELEKIVQPYANTVSMTQNVLDAVIVSVACVFIGSWSDKYGRKPILITCLLGYTLNYTLYALLSYFQNASPWLFLMGLTFNISGGFASFLSTAYSHISDMTSEENRGIKMGAAEVAIYSGTLIGMLCSSYLLKAVDYYYSFGICALATFVGILFTVFAIPESVIVTESNNKFRELFTTNHIKDMFRVVFRRREQNRRAILLLLLTIMGIYVFCVNDSTVLFLYLRRVFAWTLESFTIYEAACEGLWVVGTIFVVYGLHKMLKIPESVLLAIGFLSLLNEYLMYGLASKNWHIYAGGVVKMFGGGVSPLVRTLMSKMVEAGEIGKVFSFLLPLQTLLGIVVYPIYALVYNATIDTAPSAYNFVTAGVISTEIIMVLAVMHLQRKQNDVDYAHLEEDLPT